MLINFLVRTLKCTETLVLYFFCPFQNHRTFQYCRLAQNQRKFKILFHENSSPRDSNIMTLSARLLVQPPVVVYTALPYTAIARSCFSIDSMTTVAARGVRLATE